MNSLGRGFLLRLTCDLCLSKVTNQSACIPDQGTGIDRIFLAQLTQLYMTLKLECPFYEVRHVSSYTGFKTRPGQHKNKGLMHSQKPEYTPSHGTCHWYVR